MGHDREDDEVIPPEPKSQGSGRAVVKRPDTAPATAPLKDPGGVINTALTGWQADRRAKSFRKLAGETRAKADYVNARGELAESYISAGRAVNKLNELPEILEHDKAVREAKRKEELAQAQRAAEYADIGRQATVEMRQAAIDLVKARKEGKIVELVGILPAEEPAKPAEMGDAILSQLQRELSEALSLGNDPDKLYEQIAARKAWLADNGRGEGAT